jgi:hypothetical protein
MTRQGKIAAISHAQTLPIFANKTEAERTLFSFRDERLAQLAKLAAGSKCLEITYLPASLKTLERWYFNLLESDGFSVLGTTRAIFEECMAMYFLETAVRNSAAEWTVEENVFERGRYELGVKGSVNCYMMRITRLPLLKQNKRRESLYRDYQRWFGRNRSTLQ